MGCGGSKQDVATGNTTSRRALGKKPSDASYYASAASTDTSGNLQVPPPPPADVKDITVSSTNAGVDAGEGKLLSRSPDRYFSSRKDDEAADAAAAGGEYFSPRYVPDQAIAKEMTGLAAEGAAGSTTAAATPAADRDGGQALGVAALKGDEGMLNGELPGDLKEPILVEEAKFEVTGR